MDEVMLPVEQAVRKYSLILLFLDSLAALRCFTPKPLQVDHASQPPILVSIAFSLPQKYSCMTCPYSVL